MAVPSRAYCDARLAVSENAIATTASLSRINGSSSTSTHCFAACPADSIFRSTNLLLWWIPNSTSFADAAITNAASSLDSVIRRIRSRLRSFSSSCSRRHCARISNMRVISMTYPSSMFLLVLLVQLVVVVVAVLVDDDCSSPSPPPSLDMPVGKGQSARRTVKKRNSFCADSVSFPIEGSTTRSEEAISACLLTHSSRSQQSPPPPIIVSLLMFFPMMALISSSLLLAARHNLTKQSTTATFCARLNGVVGVVDAKNDARNDMCSSWSFILSVSPSSVLFRSSPVRSSC
mmetsp:Transcript_19003/g.45883  ORF Transcript_19003/g.45883 Transcript_19003/m.45883 type:complete len:290 (-) Transcript_19003:323-1192(-)